MNVSIQLTCTYFSLISSRYNQRIQQYIDQLPVLQTLNFFLDNQTLTMHETPKVDYYPLADSCEKEGDPEGGCMFSSSMYYATNISLAQDVVKVNLYTSNYTLLVSDEIPTEYSRQYTMNLLDCWDVYTCVEACARRDGNWNYVIDECIVSYSLTSICYRVSLTDSTAVLDTSEWVYFSCLT